MKLNNKGFAISTVIYGLSIMGILLVALVMASMAATRSNSRQMAQSIEEDLNRFSKTETFFDVKDETKSGIVDVPVNQEYVVPTNGWYRIELWGSKGGNESNGAYTSGIIKLKEGDILYFYVGKNGRETDVRIMPGDYNSTYSASTRIMVAAGGGSDANSPGGTLYGYKANMKSTGGFIASQTGTQQTYDLVPPSAPSSPTQNTSTNGSLVGFPSNYNTTGLHHQPTGAQTAAATTHLNSTTGGGDGYYPSGSKDTGGISYIAGYAGCTPLYKGTVSTNPLTEVFEQKYDADTDSGKIDYGASKGIYYFLDGIMLANSNPGKGKAKIERMVSLDGKTDAEYNSSTLNKKNPIFKKNIKKVRDCVETSTTNPLDKIIVIAGGRKISKDEKSGDERIGNKSCITVELNNQSTNVDEIAVFHNITGVDYKKETVEILDANDNNWYTLKNNSGSTISETETVTGIRFSAYQQDSTQPLPDIGTYYIMPVLSENKVVSGAKISTEAANSLAIETMNGYKRQRWVVEKIEGTNYYKIYELSRYGAMSLIEDENISGQGVNADTAFNKYNEDSTQYWEITPVSNGTYKIATKIPAFDSNTGYVIAQTNQSVARNNNKLELAKNNIETARFKFISVEYSSN